MPFAHLKSDRIKELKKAFVDANQAYDELTRTVMMVNIAPEFVQRLRASDAPRTQLALDLDKLNSVAKLSNGLIPLEAWLDNGVSETFAGLQQAAVFQQALNEMRLGPAEPPTTDIIVEGIEALVQLIRDNRSAYESVIYYRKTFDRALGEIDVIAHYKVLHDGLHKLQLNWPENNVVTVFLITPGMQSTLINYSASLNQAEEELRAIFDKGYVDGAEKIWIDELKKGQVQLEYFLGLDRQEEIKGAFNTIKSLLTKHLSLLNTRLKGAINKLRLDDLIKAMDEVCDALRILSPVKTSEQIQQYKLGVQELTKLDERIKELITQHDEWQGADDLLRTLGETLKTGAGPGQARTAIQEGERLVNMRFIKVIIETKVGPLLAGKTGFWSQRLLDSSRKFSAEVDQSNTDRAEQAFDMYREQAWHFFYEIDSEMIDRCEELKVIGQNLRKINDQLKFNEELDS